MLLIEGVPKTRNNREVLVPPDAVTANCRPPTLAFAAILNVAVRVVLFTASTFDAVTLVPLRKLMLVPPVTKFEPGIVTFTDCPKLPCCGLGGPVIVGADAVLTVKVTPLLVPADVVTVTVSLPAGAVPAMVRVALIRVELTTLTPLAVTPVPLTATVAPLAKFVPVKVMGTLLPGTPLPG